MKPCKYTSFHQIFNINFYISVYLSRPILISDVFVWRNRTSKVYWTTSVSMIYSKECTQIVTEAEKFQDVRLGNRRPRRANGIYSSLRMKHDIDVPTQKVKQREKLLLLSLFSIQAFDRLDEAQPLWERQPALLSPSTHLSSSSRNTLTVIHTIMLTKFLGTLRHSQVDTYK